MVRTSDARGSAGISAFVLEPKKMKGITFERHERKMGWRGAPNTLWSYGDVDWSCRHGPDAPGTGKRPLPPEYGIDPAPSPTNPIQESRLAAGPVGRPQWPAVIRSRGWRRRRPDSEAQRRVRTDRRETFSYQADVSLPAFDPGSRAKAARLSTHCVVNDITNDAGELS